VQPITWTKNSSLFEYRCDQTNDNHIGKDQQRPILNSAAELALSLAVTSNPPNIRREAREILPSALFYTWKIIGEGTSLYPNINVVSILCAWICSDRQDCSRHRMSAPGAPGDAGRGRRGQRAVWHPGDLYRSHRLFPRNRGILRRCITTAGTRRIADAGICGERWEDAWAESKDFLETLRWSDCTLEQRCALYRQDESEYNDAGIKLRKYT